MAEVTCQDYRRVAGTFDRIISIEMLEAVGREYWPVFFNKLHDLLRPGGVAVLQVITIAEARFETYFKHPDFIQRSVFPGGMLPSRGHLHREIDAANLQLTHEETFGMSYARTLADWRQRFEAAWPAIAALGYTERFKRLWRYYLAYCEGGFRADNIDVGLYRIERAV
jgi:cyclopropane-fatty-acyl-phospholipid synthase